MGGYTTILLIFLPTFLIFVAWPLLPWPKRFLKAALVAQLVMTAALLVYAFNGSETLKFYAVLVLAPGTLIAVVRLWGAIFQDRRRSRY